MAKRKKIVTKTKKEVPVTVCGALCRTGPSVHQKPGAPGGKVTRVNHGAKVKKKVRNSGMTVAESLGDLGDGTHHVGP